MNPDLERLRPYPFERLAALKQRASGTPAAAPIALSIGEPKHPTPHFLTEAFIAHAHGLGTYPTTKGARELRETIAQWLERRFKLSEDSVDPDRHVIPVTGTREALFAFAQAAVAGESGALVLMPNPFYQIYEGAALLAGATPHFLSCTSESGYLPDLTAVPESVWRRCQLVYICTPGNPSGAVFDEARLAELIALADRYDFLIASDECYSEIYADETSPPAGLLQACAGLGRHDFKRCVVFHSLSKRSNAPGLRSGFVAGDGAVLERFLLYRTYHGCAMPLHVQAASIAAWRDEEHVRRNREAYRAKFAAVADILKPALPELTVPSASFYLWPKLPMDDAEFALGLYERYNVTVLPGSYLSREVDGENPGAQHVRIALVAPLDECVDAAYRIREYLENL